MLDVLTFQFDLLSKPVDPKNEFANLYYLHLLSIKIFRKIRKPKVEGCKVFKVTWLLLFVFLQLVYLKGTKSIFTISLRLYDF